VQDIRAKLEELRAHAEDCVSISAMTTDLRKQTLFTRLASHLAELIGEVERVLDRDK